MRPSHRTIWPPVLALLLGAVTLSCGGAGDAVTGTGKTVQPPAPVVPATPVIALSTDSIVANAVAGADVMQFGIAISAGDTTTVRGLVVSIAGLGDGDSGAWLVAQLDSAAAPAKLGVRIDPRAASIGVHTATLSITATGADAKTVRVRVTIRAHPTLLVDSAVRTLSGALGDSLPALTVTVRSSGDTIATLAVGTPDCGPDAWMTARLSNDATPAVVTLALDATGMTAGTYSCRVDVRSTQALVDSSTRTVVVSLTLRQAPRIAVDLPTVSVGATAGGDATPVVVRITNGGSGTLDGLSLGAIDYGTGPTGWLTASLGGGVAPATLTLAASARSLAAGTLTAKISILSTAAGVVNAPAVITVSLVVAPKPYRFVVTQSAAATSYKISTGQLTSVTVSMFDGNASGQVASITGGTSQITGGPCPPFSMTKALAAGLVIPQTITYTVAPFALGGTPTPGSCTIVYGVTLSNGQGGSFSFTVSVAP